MTHEARSAKAHSSFHLQCGNWELPQETAEQY